METYKSNAYEGAPAASNVRNGEPVWIRVTATIPARTRAVNDVVKLSPVAEGARPVRVIVTTSAANTGMAANIGYTSDATAIKAAQALATATTAELTVADIVAAKPAKAGDDLILTLTNAGGSNPQVVTVLACFVNLP